LGYTYEEGVERKTNDISGQCEHHQVHLDVLAAHDETVENALSARIGVGFTNILKHTELGNLLLFLSEATRIGGQVRQDEGG
jgi:hypothetical protein